MPDFKVTSLESLSGYAKGSVVKLPPFGENQPFVARLRRPSLLALIKQGRIPNELLNTASDLFSGESREQKSDANMMCQMEDILNVICEASFVEPTYQEVLETGLTLTDEQKTFVFRYAQQGVQDLKAFRRE